MKHIKYFVMAGMFCLLAFYCLGCKEEPPLQSGDSEKSKAADVSDLNDLKIGVSMYTLGNPYFKAQLDAARRKAKELGFEFAYTNAQDDMVKQLANVEDLLAQGIDLLIFNPKDPQGSIPATKMATKAGVPVIVIDSSIDPSADFVTTVQSNNRQNGILIGEWIVEQMEGERIKMGLLSGVAGNPVGRTRRNGVFTGIIEAQLRSYSEIRFDIVSRGWGDWYNEGGLRAMEDMLVAHPEINLMLAENDSMALGAMEAIKEAGRQDDIRIAACADGQKEALKLIKEGKYGATGMNNPVLIAETAIEIGLKVLKGERDFPQKSYTPAVCITKENVDKYYEPNAPF